MKNKVGTAILITALGAMGSASSAYAQVVPVPGQQQIPPVPGQATPAGQQPGQQPAGQAGAPAATPTGQNAITGGQQAEPFAIGQQGGQFGAGQGTIEEGWVINPSITVTETFTDDVDLDATFAQSDFVTTTTLGLEAITDGPRFDLNLNYALNHLFYPSLDDDEFRHNLQMNSQTEVLRDLFYFDVAAGVNQQFIDRRGAFTSVTVSQTTNRATVSIIDANPYTLHRVGGNFATMRTGYNYSYVNSSQNLTLDGVDLGGGTTEFHEGSVIFDSGTRFTRTIWNWENLYQTQKRTNANDLDVYSSIVTGDYQINREVAAIGSIGYTKRVGDAAAANFDGVVWRVGGRLTPGPRTILEGSYGKDFFDHTWEFTGSYQITANMIFNASYTDRYQTFAENALQNFQDGVGNNADINQQFVNSQFTRIKEYRAAVTGTRGRSTITVSAIRRQTESDNADTNFTRNSVGFLWVRRLNTNLTMNIAANLMEDDFEGAIQTDTFLNAEFRLDYALSADLTASFEYIRTRREQALFGFTPRNSNYISLSLGYVF